MKRHYFYKIEYNSNYSTYLNVFVIEHGPWWTLFLPIKQISSTSVRQAGSQSEEEFVLAAHAAGRKIVHDLENQRDKTRRMKNLIRNPNYEKLSKLVDPIL